ncbi:hypothetical protein OC846_002331 [Tilletia horrida]|uniref:Transglycosylase SLT domain-containing protein n=1 Tax=Tilletia horrida TaxID=155126 RepID=A0AAN6GRE8_9BASI|nr:hypothetical protein OC845_001432 [Tilletia horrida]KAK0553934.1 hypothetical protein OC846_002331 [Tilletia horrida]KAK0567488.1 hypothetical protein OC861_002711 [Tilletia horrida]
MRSSISLALGFTAFLISSCQAAPLPRHSHLHAAPAPTGTHGTIWTPASRGGSLRKLNLDTPGKITLYSNDPNYDASDAQADLKKMMGWAGDSDQLTEAEKKETVAAILDVAHRYFPELSTPEIVRTIMADIKAESDFEPGNISPGRLGSGASVGMLQISPYGSGELKLFQRHARISDSNAGPLTDYETGRTLDAGSLSNDDLLRPWVNIHVATWIQANLGKSGSLDPSDWSAYNAGNHRQGGGMPRNMRTAYGSWVAGPHPDGAGSYRTKGDDISPPYIRSITEAIAAVAGSSVGSDYLDSLSLQAGLVDYH